MHPPNSSTSSSELSRSSLSGQPDQSGGAWRTLVWIIAFSVLIEIGLSIGLSIPAVENSGIGRYFGYGASIESKIRHYVEDPDLSPRSVFYAGWLDPATWPPEGQSNDIAVYGMSYAGNLAAALRRQDPELDVRMIGGPGAPLSHSYAAYGLDVGRRKAKTVLITMLSSGVRDMAGLTHDTTFNDHSQPATWPVYQKTLEGVEVKAWPVIDSARSLRRALTDEPALWAQHLDQLEAEDPNFSRFLYAAHWTENWVVGRVLRRAWAKAREREWSQSLALANGQFNPEAYGPSLTRSVLRSFVTDVRRNGEKPIVVLFSQPGSGGELWQLVGDILEEMEVPTILSEPFCASDVGDHYTNSHFLPHCDDLMAASLLELDRAPLIDVTGADHP
jgi:hypothetical protein